MHSSFALLRESRQSPKELSKFKTAAPFFYKQRFFFNSASVLLNFLMN